MVLIQGEQSTDKLEGFVYTCSEAQESESAAGTMPFCHPILQISLVVTGIIQLVNIS